MPLEFTDETPEEQVKELQTQLSFRDAELKTLYTMWGMAHKELTEVNKQNDILRISHQLTHEIIMDQDLVDQQKITNIIEDVYDECR